MHLVNISYQVLHCLWYESLDFRVEETRFFLTPFFVNCTRSDDRCRRSVTTESKGSQLRARSRLHSLPGEERGGWWSCDVEGICRRWRLPHSTGRRNISRTTCVDPTPLSSGLHLCPPTLSPAALCPSVSPLITGDYTRSCVRSRCDNIWLQIDRCICRETREL